MAEGLEAELKMLEAKISKRYHAKGDGSLGDIWRHFTTRGHKGPVTCIDSCLWADYIVTGGLDYSVRIWKFNARFEAYDLVAITQMEIPSHLKNYDEATCFYQLKESIWPTKVEWEKVKRQGVTALCCTTSPHPDCPALLRAGPIVSGSTEGAIYITDITRKTKIDPINELHKGPINGIAACVLKADSKISEKASNEESDPNNYVTLLLMTASEDKTAQLIKIRCREVPSPDFFPQSQADPEGLVDSFVDVFWRGGGGRVAARAARRQSDLEWQQSNGIDTTLAEDDPILEYIDHEVQPDLCKHEFPVKSVRSLGNSGEDKACANPENRATFASCCQAYIGLWDIKGQELTRLYMDIASGPYWDVKREVRDVRSLKCDSITGISVVNKPKGSLLFASGIESPDSAAQRGAKTKTANSLVAVWGLEAGLVGLAQGDGQLNYDEKKCRDKMKEKPKPQVMMPLCMYVTEGSNIDIDQAGGSTTFVCQLLEDKQTVNMWDIEAVDPNRLILEPEGPASLLLVPGTEKSLEMMNHISTVKDFRVVEDSEGPALVCGTEEGTAFIWDLEGDDAGQIYGELRSMDPLEILVPVIMLFVTVAQVFSFAFGPAIPWQKEVHTKAVVAHKFMMLDFKSTITIKKEDIFWPEMTIIMGLILLFHFFAIFDIPHVMDTAVRGIQDMANGGPVAQALRPFLKPLALNLRSFTYLLMQLLSTVLVVPMVQSCAQAVDCVWDEDLHWVDVLRRNYTVEQLHLGAVPTVQCYSGPHLKLVILMWVAVPAYLLLLLPYAVCSGDAQYINSKALWDMKIWKSTNAWRLASKRKATDMHLGFLHPYPSQAFDTLAFELLSKVALPVVTTWTTSKPLLQMSMVSTIGFFLWFFSVLKAPYVERKWCVLVQDLKCLIFMAMCCGVLTVVLNNPKSSLTMEILVGCFVWVLFGLILKWFFDEKVRVERPNVTVYAHDDFDLAGPVTAAGDDVEAPLLQKREVLAQTGSEE